MKNYCTIDIRRQMLYLHLEKLRNWGKNECVANCSTSLRSYSTNIMPVFSFICMYWVFVDGKKKSLLHFILKFLTLLSYTNFPRCNIFIRISYTVMLALKKIDECCILKNSMLAFVMWSSNSWWCEWTWQSKGLIELWKLLPMAKVFDFRVYKFD